MNLRWLTVALGLILAGAPARPASAQPSPSPAGPSHGEFAALREQVNAMQKDLDEIKALLAPLRERQPSLPANLVLDLGNRPVRGEPTAKLTFVELTDYQ